MKFNVMSTQKLNPLPTLETIADKTNVRLGKSSIKSAQEAKPIDPGDLSPLERQRLDTAVMMLVNYLISASSEA